MKNDKTRLFETPLAHDEEIFFSPLPTPNQVAGFSLCPVMENGRIRRVIISPMHQPNALKMFVIESPFEEGWEGMHLDVLLYEDKLQYVKLNRVAYCKEHNCNTIQIYPPRAATSFKVTTALGHFNLKWK